MIQLIFLGTASAIPDESHENTHFAISGSGRLILVDCSGSPVIRLKQAGLNILAVTDLIMTHFHPDHVSGVPLFLMQSWLLGRKKPLHVYGLAHTLDRVRQIMELYDWQSWPGFYQVIFHQQKEQALELAFEDEEYRVFTSPVKHLIPAVGLRIELKRPNATIAYSCDTEPCEAVETLARNADYLIHEATGAMQGHSSARQAGEIASRAHVQALYLVHYDIQHKTEGQLLEEAKSAYPGEVYLAQDFTRLVF